MAKAIIFLVSAICFLSLLNTAHGQERFSVEGQVYCDTCRAQFVTRVSEYVKGAWVVLLCRARENGTLTYRMEGETNELGTYSIPVEGDHEDDICEVQLLKSSRDDCNEIDHDDPTQTAATARVSITTNSGMQAGIRRANPLGFLKKDLLPVCPEVFKELGLNPDGSFVGGGGP